MISNTSGDLPCIYSLLNEITPVIRPWGLMLTKPSANQVFRFWYGKFKFECSACCIYGLFTELLTIKLASILLQNRKDPYIHLCYRKHAALSKNELADSYSADP